MSNKYDCFLSKYACIPSYSKGRAVFEPNTDEFRSCFQHDRDRIIHSGAFRKLEYKTQVFINYESDYYRTRLTHSLEVSQISRSLSRRFGLNEDLAEAISLAHDLGHPPFGHAGERGLQSVAEKYYRFDHNVQALRVLIELEHRYARFNGMNLSWETLEGIAKHNGPQLGKYCISPTTNPVFLKYASDYEFDLHEFSSAEAQISSISDDIAYNVHDVDDGLRSNLLSIDDLYQIDLVADIFNRTLENYPNISKSQLVHESLRHLMTIMIEDVSEQFSNNIRNYQIKSVNDIRKLNVPVVHFSPEILVLNQELQKILSLKVYNNYRVNRITSKTQRIVRDLFNVFWQEPHTLPPEWSNLVLNSDSRAMIICDFIAGMTDRFAVQEHRRIFDYSYEMSCF